MANNPGIRVDLTILEAEQEQAIRDLSIVGMEFAPPTAFDMNNDPVFVAASGRDFADLWDDVFPEIGKDFMVHIDHENSEHWGSLTTLSRLHGGVKELREGEHADLPEVVEALAVFRDVLVQEANEVGNGMQAYIAENEEAKIDQDLKLVKKEIVTDPETKERTLIKSYTERNGDQSKIVETKEYKLEA